MYKNLLSIIDTQNTLRLKNIPLCLLTILILTGSCITGCDKISTTEFLDAFVDPILEVKRTIPVTLNEKNASGISGTATFKEYVGADSEAGSTSIKNLDIEIQNAVAGRSYAAYIYTGNSCSTPGTIWNDDGYTARSFIANDDGTGERSYTVDIDITNINGKVLVIHEQIDADDLENGTQVSCGVITLSE